VSELAHFYAGTQFISFGAGKGDEGRASVSQSLSIGLTQQGQRSFCFTITGSTYDDERAFGEAFRFRPGLAATASIFR
jgi:hypothetical protein